MKNLIATILILAVVACAGCSSKERQQNLNDTFVVLNDNGVLYEGELSGPTNAKFELFSGGRFGSEGHFAIRIQSPRQNPAANYLKADKDEPVETTEAPPAE